jgi:hypothetical protein
LTDRESKRLLAFLVESGATVVFSVQILLMKQKFVNILDGLEDERSRLLDARGP